jgi:HD-like signal output (HDOD) protein
VRVLELTENPKVDVRALKDCVETDPALTAKVLRVVNSALFGLSREVTSLNQALALLGTKPLKLLVLGFSLPDALFRGIGATFLEQYWRRTLTRAVVARALAEQYWRIPGDDAFIAALLEDIGLLVIAQELGETWITFYDRVRRERADLIRMEVKALGFHHAALTARLLDQWKLPSSLSEAINAVEAPAQMATLQGSTLELAQLLRISNLISVFFADDREEVLTEIRALGAEYRGLTERDFDELLRDLEQRVAQLAEALSLDLTSAFPYDQVWKTAHERLIGASASLVQDIARLRAGEEETRLLDECEALSAAVRQSVDAPRPRTETASAADTVPRESRNTVVARATPARLANVRKSERAAPQVSDPSLLGRLTTAITAARHARCSASLICVALDHQDDVLLHLGPNGLRQWVDHIRRVCQRVDHAPPPQCLELADGRWMILLIDCDRRQAVEHGHHLLRAVRDAAQPHADVRLSISVGAASVALPSPNFPPKDLLVAAERCLQAALASGGNVLKSIEIY